MEPAHKEVNLRRAPLSHWTLAFREPGLERAFREDYAYRLQGQIRLSLLLGAIVYLLLAIEDLQFFGAGFVVPLRIRIAEAGMLLALFAATFDPRVAVRIQGWLAVGSVAGGVGALSMVAYGGVDVAKAYHVGVLLVVFWTYAFSGVRFTWALGANIVLFAVYVPVFVAMVSLPAVWELAVLAHFAAASLVGGCAGYVIERQRRLVFVQTTELDAARRSEAERACHDALTGLPNRLYFENRVRAARARARRRRAVFSVLFVDINDFKPVNDRFGHAVGDQVLTALAQRLRGAVRAADTVARFGGDEFVVLAEGLSAARAAATLGEQLRAAVDEPVAVEECAGTRQMISFSVSIGVAGYPEDAVRIASLLQCADDAMYQAKFAGGGIRRAVPLGGAPGTCADTAEPLT